MQYSNLHATRAWPGKSNLPLRTTTLTPKDQIGWRLCSFDAEPHAR
jgi:hypothetical protein